MFTSRDIQKIHEADSEQTRCAHVFAHERKIELFTEPDALRPQTSVPLDNRGPFGTDLPEVEKRNIAEQADATLLEPGEAFIAHETTPQRANQILSNGFANPFDHGAEQHYHCPETSRHGKVFGWAHYTNLGHHDRGGAVVLSIADIDDLAVAPYSAYAALLSDKEYRAREEPEERIRPPQYDAYYVFDYTVYLEWLQDAPDVAEHTRDTLFPYRRED